MNFFLEIQVLLLSYRRASTTRCGRKVLATTIRYLTDFWELLTIWSIALASMSILNLFFNIKKNQCSIFEKWKLTYDVHWQMNKIFFSCSQLCPKVFEMQQNFDVWPLQVQFVILLHLSMHLLLKHLFGAILHLCPALGNVDHRIMHILSLVLNLVQTHRLCGDMYCMQMNHIVDHHEDNVPVQSGTDKIIWKFMNTGNIWALIGPGLHSAYIPL